jgi:general L-amino acid transport system permease protein
MPPPDDVRLSLSRRVARTYFGTPANAAITIGCILVLVWLLPPLLNWALFKATWTGNATTCREAGGACWSFIREKFSGVEEAKQPSDDEFAQFAQMLHGFTVGADDVIADGRWRLGCKVEQQLATHLHSP